MASSNSEHNGVRDYTMEYEQVDSPGPAASSKFDPETSARCRGGKTSTSTVKVVEEDTLIKTKKLTHTRATSSSSEHAHKRRKTTKSLHVRNLLNRRDILFCLINVGMMTYYPGKLTAAQLEDIRGLLGTGVVVKGPKDVNCLVKSLESFKDQRVVKNRPFQSPNHCNLYTANYSASLL